MEVEITQENVEHAESFPEMFTALGKFLPVNLSRQKMMKGDRQPLTSGVDDEDSSDSTSSSEDEDESDSDGSSLVFARETAVVPVGRDADGGTGFADLKVISHRGDESSDEDEAEGGESVGATKSSRRRRRVRHGDRPDSVPSSEGSGLDGRLKSRLASHRVTSLAAEQVASSDISSSQHAGKAGEEEGSQSRRHHRKPPRLSMSRNGRRLDRNQRAEVGGLPDPRLPPTPKSNVDAPFGATSSDDDDGVGAEAGRAGGGRMRYRRRNSFSSSSVSPGGARAWKRHASRAAEAEAEAAVARKEVARQLRNERSAMMADYGGALAHVLFSACLGLLALHFIGSASGLALALNLEFKLLAGLCGASALLFCVEVVMARRRDQRLQYSPVPKGGDANELLTLQPPPPPPAEPEPTPSSYSSSSRTAASLHANPLTSHHAGTGDAAPSSPLEATTSAAAVTSSASLPPGVAPTAMLLPGAAGARALFVWAGEGSESGGGSAPGSRSISRTRSNDDEEKMRGSFDTGSSL